MSAAADVQRQQVQRAERQLSELQELIALWFNESNCGAREWLVEAARMHREGQRRERLAGQQNLQQIAEQT